MKQFLDKESSIDKEPQYSLHKVHALVDIVERLLFASASSLEEYSKTSTLDERFRYIVVRFLQRKMRTRIIEDDNRRQKKPSASSHRERTVDDLSQEVLSSTFQSLNIRSTTTSTRSKGSAYQLPGIDTLNYKLREVKFCPVRNRLFAACCVMMHKQCQDSCNDKDYDH
jgi:hypothetical protein